MASRIASVEAAVGIVLTASYREIARGRVHSFCCVLANIPQALNQVYSGLRKLFARFEPAPLKASIADVGIEKHQAVGHRNQRKNEADAEKEPGLKIGQYVWGSLLASFKCMIRG
jgi:hypothetical protein